jgi:alkanesulfonate monooxygenase SsuD/methylene tetrahydromethanopterin reductase-like flavin-dependent oxidoreductase (luciferase family)
MRWAFSVPNFGDFADPRLFGAIACDAEAAGWDGAFVWDHLYVWEGNRAADPWTLLAAAALGTERIRLGTMVTPLPRRRPWQVVRQVVTLDHLSGGRMTLGVGIGYPPHEEFGAFGEPEDAGVRAAILDEALEIVSGLQTGEAFGFRGAHFQLEEISFAPRPVQRPRVPIWVGGSWPNRTPFRRAARFDGVIPIMARDEEGREPLPTVQDMRAALAYTLEHRTNDGPFDAVFTGAIPDDPSKGVEIADELATFGVTWWQTSIGWPEETLERFRERIRRGPPTG